MIVIITTPTFQRRMNVVDQRCNNAENETKSEDGFSTLLNVDTNSESDVERTSKQRCTTSLQHWIDFILT